MLALKLAATCLGIIPILYVVYREWRFSMHVDAAYYWLGLAFGVSFLADAGAWIGRVPPWVGLSYVIGQSILVIAVFLSRKDALRLLGVFCLLGLLAPFVRDQHGHDLLLHTICWTYAALVAGSEARGGLRDALVVYFAGGMVCYILFAVAPTLTTWGAYQMTRVAGIALFCLAVADPRPVKLTLHRARAV